MKILVSYLKDHLREDFHLGYYLAVLLFISVCLFINYYYRLEPEYLDPLFGSYKHFIAVFSTFSIGYLGTMIIQGIYGRKVWIAERKFWFTLAFFLFIATYDISYSWYRKFIGMVPDGFYYFTVKMAKNVLSVFIVVLPLYIFHRVTKSRTRFYGLTFKGFIARPYIIICVVSLVGIASSLYNSGLSSYYPTYRSAIGHPFGEYSWFGMILYEFFYAFDFLSVELVFRGVFILGLSRWLGKEAIMPMVTIYCFLHFGKPIAEAISSIFGGFILGILAYRSKSILGGVFIHITIALGMEFFAWLFKSI